LLDAKSASAAIRYTELEFVISAILTIVTTNKKNMFNFTFTLIGIAISEPFSILRWIWN